MTEDVAGRLAEIRERADKATPGPWECEHEDYVSSVYLGSANAGSYPVQRAPIHRDTDITDRQADEARSTVEFIAHSREDAPYLLDLIDSLIAERDEALENALRFHQLVRPSDEDWVYCESCGRAPSGRRSALLDPITWRGRVSAWFRRRFGEGE